MKNVHASPNLNDQFSLESSERINRKLYVLSMGFNMNLK